MNKNMKKKTYINPAMETVELNMNNRLLAGSVTMPIDGTTDVVDSPELELEDMVLNGVY